MSRQQITFGAKLDLLAAFRNLQWQPHEFAANFGVTEDTGYKIRSTPTNFLCVSPFGAHRYRLRDGANERIEKAVLDFVKEKTRQGCSATGRELQQVALRTAQDIGMTTFKAGSSWLKCFKNRHFVEPKWQHSNVGIRRKEELLVETAFAKYGPENVFRCCTTKLFYRCMPNTVADYLRPDSKVNIPSNQMGLLLAVNELGNEKLIPLVVSTKSKKIVNSYNYESMMVYTTQAMSTVTKHSFARWIEKVDEIMTAKDRKICVITDIPQFEIRCLRNVQVIFVQSTPANGGNALHKSVACIFKTQYKLLLSQWLAQCYFRDRKRYRLCFKTFYEFVYDAWTNSTPEMVHQMWNAMNENDDEFLKAVSQCISTDNKYSTLQENGNAPKDLSFFEYVMVEEKAQENKVVEQKTDAVKEPAMSQ